MSNVVRYIVIKGDPSCGFNFHGPFTTFQEANDWAEDGDGDWWVSELWGDL